MQESFKPIEITSEIDEKEGRKAHLFQLAKEVEGAFSGNDLSLALKKIRELKEASLFESKEQKAYYEDLLVEFAAQEKILLSKNYPGKAGVSGVSREYFVRQVLGPVKEKLYEVARMKEKIKAGHIPFVIIVSDNVISLDKKFAATGGKTRVNISDIRLDQNTIIPDADAYLIVDVDDGNEMRGVTPYDAIKKLKSEGRLPLTIEEGIMAATSFPVMVSGHGVDCPGSRFGNGGVPNLSMGGGKVMEISGVNIVQSSLRQGVASCVKRIGG